MSKELTAAKEPIATQMAIFAVAKTVVDKLIPKGQIDQDQIDTIITNKIIEKCEKVGGERK